VNWDTSVVVFSEAMPGRVGRGPNRSSPDGATASSGELSFGSIVHVNEKGGSFGGTEEYLSLVTSELSRRGVCSHLVCGVLGGTGPLEFDSVHVVEGLASREPLLRIGPQLVKLIGLLDPDVIYLHNIFDPAVVSAVSAIPNRGPLIWYVHDHYLTCLTELRWRRDHGSCRERLGAGCLVAINEGRCVLRRPERVLDADELGRRKTLSRSLGQADQVIVVSEYMRSLLAEAEPRLAERIHVLPRPIRHPAVARRRQRTRSNEPVAITFAGRITPEKGLAVLIEALGSVRSESRIELFIAGVVEHQAYWSHCRLLEQRATMANAQLRVRYLGHLDYAATDELFSRSDIVAVPSQWPEPFGAVALEAMSAGATVIASQIGGLDTCLDADRCGLLVEPSDPTGWARAIEALLYDPHRAGQLAARGQARARSYTVQSHLVALDQVIGRARTHTRALDLPLRRLPSHP
jgi:glycosyltransferase involved in cell wall biosynthesis